jgi:PAS domain S-box-containing protein
MVVDMTERKRAQAALEESEAKYRDLVETSQDLIWKCDTEGRFTYLNAAWRETLGYEPDEMLGRRFADFKRPEVAARDLKTFSQILEGEPVRSYETTYLSKSGADVDLLFNAMTLLDAAGNLVGTQGTAYDITERKRAERALLEIVEGTSAELGADFFRSLVRHLAGTFGVRYALLGEVMEDAPDRVRTLAAWVGDDFGENFEYELAGTPCENVVGKTTCLYESGVQEHFPDDHLLVEMGVIGYLGAPLFDSSGNALGILVVMDDKPIEDVPTMQSMLAIFAARAAAELERKRAEEAMQESEERFRLLAENARDVIFRYRLAGARGFEYISPAVTIVTGYRPDEWYADPDFVARIVHPDDRGTALQTMREVRTDAVELRWVHKDGSIVWSEQRNVPIYDEAGRVVAVEGIIRDITERKQAEEALQRAREDLEGRVEHQMLRKNPYGLTFRELGVLHLMAGGRPDKEIARELGVSLATSQKHAANIREKMDVTSRTEAGVRALKEGLLG